MKFKKAGKFLKSKVNVWNNLNPKEMCGFVFKRKATKPPYNSSIIFQI